MARPIVFAVLLYIFAFVITIVAAWLSDRQESSPVAVNPPVAVKPPVAPGQAVLPSLITTPPGLVAKVFPLPNGETITLFVPANSTSGPKIQRMPFSLRSGNTGQYLGVKADGAIVLTDVATIAAPWTFTDNRLIHGNKTLSVGPNNTLELSDANHQWRMRPLELSHNQPRYNVPFYLSSSQDDRTLQINDKTLSLAPHNDSSLWFMEQIPA